VLGVGWVGGPVPAPFTLTPTLSRQGRGGRVALTLRPFGWAQDGLRANGMGSVLRGNDGCVGGVCCVALAPTAPLGGGRFLGQESRLRGNDEWGVLGSVLRGDPCLRRGRLSASLRGNEG
jgi:hypothetical protein